MKRNWFALWLAVNALLLLISLWIVGITLSDEWARASIVNDESDLSRSDVLYIAAVFVVGVFAALCILNLVAFGIWEVWKLIQRRQSRII